MNASNYKNIFAEVQDSSSLPDWLNQYKQDQWVSFEQIGFPTRQNEEFKYTSLKPVAEAQFTVPSKASQHLSEKAREHLEQMEFKLVFVNGLFNADLSVLPNEVGLEVKSLNDKIQSDEISVKRVLDALQTQHSLENLNLAFLKDGVWIQCGRDVSLKSPLHVVYLFDDAEAPLMVSPLNVVLVDSGSKISVVESYISFSGEQNHFINSKTFLTVSENATLNHAQWQYLNDSSSLVLSTQSQVDKNGTLHTFALDQGSKLSRHDLMIKLVGEGAHAALNGLYLTSGKQHVDHHTTVDHRVPNATSAQLYKGILDDQSRAVFNGKVFVQQDAQKTDSTQLNKNLLLSKKANVDTKPQLEIAADDVSCTHGATVGQINSEELFYFESRGIPEDQARRTLISGFSKDVLQEVASEEIKDYLYKAFHFKELV